MVKQDNGVEVCRIRRLDGESNLKAFADIAFSGMFVVRGIKVVEGKNGLFISMPQQKGKDGKWYNAAYPATKEFRELLNDVVLSAYENE